MGATGSGDKILPLDKRLSGDALLDAQDMIDGLRANGAEIDENGYVKVYHRTDAHSADLIERRRVMKAKEDGVFFSTAQNGQAEGFGDTILELSIPVEQLQIDDIFGDEAHVRVPLPNRNSTLDVSKWLKGRS